MKVGVVVCLVYILVVLVLFIVGKSFERVDHFKFFQVKCYHKRWLSTVVITLVKLEYLNQVLVLALNLERFATREPVDFRDELVFGQSESQSLQGFRLWQLVNLYNVSVEVLQKGELSEIDL